MSRKRSPPFLNLRGSVFVGVRLTPSQRAACFLRMEADIDSRLRPDGEAAVGPELIRQPQVLLAIWPLAEFAPNTPFLSAHFLLSFSQGPASQK